MRIKLLFLLGISTILFAACNAPAGETAVDMDKLKVEVQAMEDAYAAGEKAKDVDAVVAYYADDATSFNRNEPPSVGMDAIKEKIAKNIAEDTTGKHNVYKVIDLFPEGNSLVEIGSWTSINADGSEDENGYYMSYFQKRDGKWKCVRDMGVTTSPVKN